MDSDSSDCTDDRSLVANRTDELFDRLRRKCNLATMRHDGQDLVFVPASSMRAE